MKDNWDLSTWSEELKEVINDEIEDIASKLLLRIVQRTPVDTGRLKRAWGSYPGPNIQGIQTWVIDNNVPYAGYVEDGTPFMAPHKMLQLAVLDFTKGNL